MVIRILASHPTVQGPPCTMLPSNLGDPGLNVSDSLIGFRGFRGYRGCRGYGGTGGMGGRGFRVPVSETSTKKSVIA